jgi:hypothetical protein
MSLRPLLLTAVAPAAVACACLVLRCGTDSPRYLTDIAREARRQEELDRIAEAHRRSNQGKWKVVNELIAGQITLREAAGRFRQVHQATAGLPSRLPEDDRTLCRLIVQWCRTAVQNDPRCIEVTARLEEEYRLLFPPEPVPARP